MYERLCPVCGEALDGRDPRTLTCSAKCRRERRRVLALLSGAGDGPYRTLAEYEARRRKVRANVPVGV